MTPELTAPDDLLERLRPELLRPERSSPELDRRPYLIICDYDGTLAPLGLDPWGAAMVPAARRALRRLAGTPALDLAFLSGRTVGDLARLIRVGGARYLGNDGLERGRLARGARAETIVATTEPGFEAYVASVDGLAQALVKGLAEPWLIVEHKGPAVTFHFRAAPDVAAAGALVRTWVDRLDPDGRFVRHAGARMLELRPPGATTKARAMRALLAEVRPRSALVLGDGSTDAAAFQALREAAQASGGALSGLSLAVRSHGSPLVEVEAAADAVIASPAAVATLLRGLARSVRPVSGSRPVRPVSGSRMPPPGPWG